VGLNPGVLRVKRRAGSIRVMNREYVGKASKERRLGDQGGR
jgi:hypothetical protein